MSDQPLGLLLTALGTPHSCYVLGAGASAPEVPTIAQLPDRAASYARLLSSWPASPIPSSPLRQLIAPLIERAQRTPSLGNWKAAGMTDTTVALVLEDLIATAHWRPLTQYSVFRLFPLNAAVVSFNWDGLAFARCPQSDVVHPHGRLPPRQIVPGALDAALDMSQLVDGSTWLLPGLVLPGEEEESRLRTVRERVFNLWRTAPCVTVIGYSFGLHSGLRYDQVWLDTFVAAMTVNNGAAVHILSPDAQHLREELAESLKRTINVHAWPFSWKAVADALEVAAKRARASTIEALCRDRSALELLDRAVRAAPAAK